MSEIIARIDGTTPTGRRLVRELEKHKKLVKMEYPIPASIAGQQLYTVDEAFEDLDNWINHHYSSDEKI